MLINIEIGLDRLRVVGLRRTRAAAVTGCFFHYMRHQ